MAMSKLAMQDTVVVNELNMARARESASNVFADIINVLLFNGEKVVTEDSLTDVLQESILKMDGRIRTQYRDIAKYWHNSKIKLSMFGLENQTKPEKLMPLRVFGYDGSEYVQQAKKENSKETKYPVITLVLYFGYNCRWNQPKSLFELLDIDERIKPYVNDFKMNFFEIAYLDREKIDMFTVVIIGNSQSYVHDGSMITPRGYYRETDAANAGEKKEVGVGQEIMMESFRTIRSEMNNPDIPLYRLWPMQTPRARCRRGKTRALSRCSFSFATSPRCTAKRL